MADVNLILIGSDTLVQLENVKDAETDELLNTATITMSLFKGVSRNPVSSLAFTSGGIYQVQVGDVIIEQGGDLASATVEAVHVTSGSWAAGTAAGTFEVSGQNGVFTAAQLLDVGAEANVATASGESTGLAAVTANAGAKTKIPMHSDDLTATTGFVRIEGTINYDGQYAIDAKETGYITIVKAYAAETFTGEENIYIGIVNGKDIALTHVGGDADGYYDGILPDTLIGLLVNVSYYLFIRLFLDPVVVLHRYYWEAKYYEGD